MIINHNASAAFASRLLGERTHAVQESIQILASGERINKASDDASGMAVSEKLRSQIRGLNQASRNVANGVSFIQTAEGYLNETTNLLQRIRELAIQAANGIYSAEDRTQIQVEVSQLVAEINRVASHAQFNGMTIFTGSFAKDSAAKRNLTIQVGANMDQQVQIFIGTMTTAALKLTGASQGSASPAPAGSTGTAAVASGAPKSDGGLSLSSVTAANTAIGTIDSALSRVSRQRSDLGAFQNRLEAAQRGIDITAENLTAAESRIRDADMAKQMVEYMTEQILATSSSAMLAQANASSSSVMKLLG